MAKAAVEDKESEWKMFQQNVCDNIATKIKNDYNPKIDLKKVSAEAWEKFEEKRGKTKYTAYWKGKTYDSDYTVIARTLISKYISVVSLEKSGLAKPDDKK